MRRRRLLSPLYCRYNGFMFGVFSTMSLFPVVEKRFSRFRRRILEFLDEIQVRARIPDSAEAYRNWDEDARFRLLMELHGRSPLLANSAAAGQAAIHYVLGDGQTPLEIVHELLGRIGIPPGAFDRFAAEVPAEPRISEVLSPALGLLNTSLAGLRREPRTCFVALPFRRPYEGYFPRFYRPALESYGQRALRAWGGVGMEDYLELVLTLIGKSGSVMADISTLNPNVVYEVGVAQGMGKTVYLLSRNPTWKLPANLAQHKLYRFHYSTRSAGWEQEAILRFPAQMAFVEYALAVQDEPEDPAEPEAPVGGNGPPQPVKVNRTSS